MKATLNTYKFITILVTIVFLQGCVAAAVVTVGTGVKVATDRRTVGHQIDDQTIVLNAYNKLNAHKDVNDNTNIQLISLNGKLLVVGQAPTEHLRDSIIKILSDINGVSEIYNQIRITNTTSVLTKSHDAWLTSKVKVALLADDRVDGTNIKVVTENGEVFLMGLVTPQEANIAVDIARNISGVNRVVKAFEYIQK
jgi:osmotically-inducible protein OsmY